VAAQDDADGTRPPGRAPVPQPRPSERSPTEIGTPPRLPWWQRQRPTVKLGLIAAVVVILTAAGITAYLLRPNASRQTVLPFTGLNQPCAVAVDTVGDLYIVDSGNNRVVKLAAGSSTQTVLPFTGLNQPSAVAVDAAGDVYVTEHGNNQVVKLPAGSSTQTVLPFTGLNQPYAVAVDAAGNLYVADWGNNRVLKLPGG